MTEEATGAESAVESEQAPETPIEETAVAATEVEPEVEAEPDEFADVVSLDAEAEADPETDEAEGDEEAEETEVELIEFNFGGNKLEVPKGALPEELEAKVQEFANNTWSDYTKGKQAIADEAKTIAADREAVAKLTTLNGEALQTYSHGLTLRQEIEQLSRVDLNAEWQSNPDRARQISDTLATKQAEFQHIIGLVGQQETALDAAQQEDTVRRAEEGKQMLDRRIKGFSTEIAPQVVKYVVETFGMAQEQADQWAGNPTMTQMAYESMMYRRMQAAPKKAKVTPAQAKPLKPMKASGNGTGPKKADNDLSYQELGKVLGIG